MTTPTALAFTVDRLIALPRVGNVAPSPCGTWVAAAVQRLDLDGAKYVSDLWKIPLDPAQTPEQLTRGDCKDTAPCFRHDGALAFLSNRKPNDRKPDDDADKRMQVWLLPAGGGEPMQLTDEPLGVDAFHCAAHAPRLVLMTPVLPGVAPDAQRATLAERNKQGPSAMRYTRQPVRYWDHWQSDEARGPHTHFILIEADGSRRDLTPDAVRQLAVEPGFDLSADGRRAVCTWTSVGVDRIENKALRVFDLDAGTDRLIGVESQVSYEGPKFSPDGAQIAVLRDVRVAHHAPMLRLALFDAASGARTDIAPDWDTWPQVFGWTADGKGVLAGADLRGRSAVFRVEVASGRVDLIAADGSFTEVSALDAKRIVGVRSRIAQPPEVFVAKLDDAPPVRVNGTASTTVALHAVPASQLLARLTAPTLPAVSIEELDIPSTDGTPIHTFLLKPAGAQGKLPLVMFIHGGPVSAFGDGWHWRWNPLLLIERGYAVALPNPRGSTGYGQAFIEGIWNNTWGGQCYADLMAVADALERRPDIDPARTAAMGGSFGGYMTNWIGGQTDRFKCLITHASVYWMQAFTGTTDHPPFWFYELDANPDTPADVFDRYSPHRFARNWKSPVLILHGEKDYRCPVSESLMLFEALQERGVASELMIFPDENHWILKPRNIAAWYDAVGEFLDRHLKP